MENQFLIMQLKKLDSPIKNMSEHQLIFFDIDDPRYIPFRRQQRSKISSENEKLYDFQSCLELRILRILEENTYQVRIENFL